MTDPDDPDAFASMTARQAYLSLHDYSLANSRDSPPPDLTVNSREFSPTMPDMPSQHSGFRTNINSEYSEQTGSSLRSYSPPAWRKAGSGWFEHHHQPSLSPSRIGGYASKEASPQYHDALQDGEGDVTMQGFASRIPLPRSPTKGRSPSNSPEPNLGFGAGEVDRGGGGAHVNASEEPESPNLETPTQSNCKFNFSLRSSLPLRSSSLCTNAATRLSLSCSRISAQHGAYIHDSDYVLITPSSYQQRYRYELALATSTAIRTKTNQGPPRRLPLLHALRCRATYTAHRGHSHCSPQVLGACQTIEVARLQLYARRSLRLDAGGEPFHHANIWTCTRSHQSRRSREEFRARNLLL